MVPKSLRVSWSLVRLCPLAVLVCSVAPVRSNALELRLGDVSGSWDTTLSYGVSYRVQRPDKSLIGLPNGGWAYSVNNDDGTLNYGRSMFSNAAKITSELQLDYGFLGGFIRGTGFYDFEGEDGHRERAHLSKRARDLVGHDVRLLDAYITASFDVLSMPVQIRLGEQVVSWGESTFIPHGINVINPVDVTALRVPGAELREAFLPQGMVWGTVGMCDNASFEAFYQYDWDETIIDPPGSYFSTNDYAGEGGSRVQLGFGAAPEGDFLGVPRERTKDPDDQGQFGLAMRVFAPSLHDTEFGFYFINHHSALPLISARTGTLQGALNAGAVGANAPGVIGTSIATFAANPADPVGAITSGVVNGMGNGMTQSQAGLIAQTTVETYAGALMGGATTPAAQGAAAAAGATAAVSSATDAYARTARYFTEYPEDIQVFGVSFNTEVGSSGIALQGEYSFHKDQPLQVDDLELLFAALGPINAGLAAANQVGNYTGQFTTIIPGFIERDVSQVQATLTKIIPQVAWADQLVLLGEAGAVYVHNMPDKDDLRLNGPATFISGNQALAGVHGPAAGQFEDEDNFADQTSWGYRAIARLTYNDVFAGVNLMPRIAWQHGVDGITPGPASTFLEDRKAITLGLTGTYRHDWAVDVSYTNYFGAGRYNLVNDRDFISATIKYSF